MPGTKASQHTIEDVVAWAEKMIERGTYVATTAKNRITALRDLTSVLGEDESKEPQSILDHLDDYADRWARKEGATSSTVLPKKSHARSLLTDFISFQKDPTGFKSSKRTAVSQQERTNQVSGSKGKAKSGMPPDLGAQGSQQAAPSIHLDIQIHISPDASEKQIDTIFESMAKHLNLKK